MITKEEIRKKYASREGLPESFPKITEKHIDLLVELHSASSTIIETTPEERRQVIDAISSNRPAYYHYLGKEEGYRQCVRSYVRF